MKVEVRILGDKWLVSMSGRVTVKLFKTFLAQVNKNEMQTEGSISRLILFSEEIDFADFNYNQSLEIAKVRVEHELPQKSKSAFVASDEFNFGFARMWATITSNIKFDANAFRQPDEALEWLGWTMDDYKTLSEQAPAYIFPEPE